MMRRFAIVILTALMASGCSAQATTISDEELRTIFPEYPQIVIFKSEYLDFFSETPERERSRIGDDIGTYVLEGDFDGDGDLDIAVSGLLDIEPIDGKYNGFIAIIEEETREVEFFQRLFKTVGNPRAIQNILLFQEADGNIRVGFQYETDFVGFVAYNGEYKFSVP